MAEYTKEINEYLFKLFPIARSITGKGNRQTLKHLQEIIPLRIKEYPSGDDVYDWIVPKEWNIQDAWIKNSRGDKIVNFQKNNLHVVGYSIPVHKKMKLDEFDRRLHFLKEIPDAIPYRTSYYKEDWGFCLSYSDYKKYFNYEEEYEVFINSSFEDGYLTIGELLIAGKSEKEYLISTYICHPSMANDNLSGILLTSFLAKELLSKDLNFSYKFIFVPETIGAICYCANNERAMKNIDCGFVITSVGGPGKFGYKASYDETHYINSLIQDVFEENRIDYIRYPFDIHGSDERQYSSIGFRINVASITKDKYYEYDYYHTSKDDLRFVTAAHIDETLKLYVMVIEKLDMNIVFKNKYPNCEVMLSKHGLYPTTGAKSVYKSDRKQIDEIDIILWLNFYCDGNSSLYEISKKTGVPLAELYETARKLEQKEILERKQDKQRMLNRKI